MDKDKRQDRIDEYLLGKGAPEERSALEAEFSSDESLSRELGDTELALAAIELAEDQALKARLQGLEQKLVAETPGSTVAPPLTAKTSGRQPEAKVVKMRQRSKGPFRLMAYAAALLLVLAVGWWALSVPGGVDARQLAMDNFTPYKNIATGTVRGENDNSAETAAFKDYDNGSYATAAAKFSALPLSPVNQFYLGQSLLAQQKYDEALAVFSPLMAATDFPFAEESAYYNALAQLGHGDVEEAKKAMAKISGTENHPLQQEAAALLAKM